MTKSQKPTPDAVPANHTPPRAPSPVQPPRVEGNLAKQPEAPPRSQGEQKPLRFFKVRTDHH